MPSKPSQEPKAALNTSKRTAKRAVSPIKSKKEAVEALKVTTRATRSQRQTNLEAWRLRGKPAAEEKKMRESIAQQPSKRRRTQVKPMAEKSLKGPNNAMSDRKSSLRSYSGKSCDLAQSQNDAASAGTGPKR